MSKVLITLDNQCETIRHQSACYRVTDGIPGKPFTPVIRIDLRTDDCGSGTVSGINKIKKNGLPHLIMDREHQPVIQDQYGKTLEIPEFPFILLPIFLVQVMEFVEKSICIGIQGGVEPVASLHAESLGKKRLAGASGTENTEILVIEDEVT